jgi:osmotically-inducible protein OsmY
MADRYDEQRQRRDEYRGESRYGWRDRGVTERAGDEVRSWFGDEEAERRRRIDERERRDRERGRDYGPGYEQEWGDYPYRGETWRGGETWGGWGSEPGRIDYGRREYRSYPRPRTELYRHPYGGAYGFGWETRRPSEFRGRGPKGYQRPDARIDEDVCDRLADAPDIDASDIEVKTTNGEVMLSGSVHDREEKRHAEDLIEAVSGVREVHNNLRISRPQEETIRTRQA